MQIPGDKFLIFFFSNEEMFEILRKKQKLEVFKGVSVKNSLKSLLLTDLTLIEIWG